MEIHCLKAWIFHTEAGSMATLSELLSQSSSDSPAALDVALKVIVSLLAGLRSKTGRSQKRQLMVERLRFYDVL